MFIWISKAAIVTASLTLAGCAGVELAPASRGVAVLGGAVQVMPPTGYCADPKVSSGGADSAVVLMGRCKAGSSAVPALMTASIGVAGSGAALDAGPVALTRFFSSEQGRGMLASSGDAEDVIVTAAQTEENALMLQLQDANLGPYWRAVMAVQGRLVMLSATSVQSVALDPQDGRVLVTNTVLALRKANGEAKMPGIFASPAASAAQAAPTVVAATAPTTRPMPRPSAAISG
jgi:hypothetical protein